MTVSLDGADRHLELRSAAIVARLLARLGVAHGSWFDRDDPEDRFPFLVEYRRGLEELAGSVDRAGDPRTFEQRAAELASGFGGDLPLARLEVAGIGGTAAVDVLVTAALVERDVQLGAVFASLQAPSASRRPCLGLLAWLLDPDVDVIAVTRRLGGAGLVEVDNPDDPRDEQVVRVPPAVLDVIDGDVPQGAGLTHLLAAPTAEDLVVTDEVRRQVERIAELTADGALDAVVVRGAGGTGRRTVLRHLAGLAGRALLVADAGGPAVGVAGGLALLTGSDLAWSVDPAIGELAEVERGIDGSGSRPVGVVIGRHGAVRVRGGERVATIELASPDRADRRRFWTMSGLPASAAVLDVVAERYLLSGGTIGHVGERALAVSRVSSRDEVVVDDVRRAARELGRQQLEAYATLLAPLAPGRGPVLGGATESELEALVLRCRHREAVPEAVTGTAAEGMARGVRALFSGPSGTGKTFAARSLADRLDLDVYRADLATIVDKYIGETERKLHELLQRAEELDVVLLLDEGDSLLSRRTDVRTSTDRYANLETNYLLQRLETYEGIIVVTTNAAHLVDQAFLRRLDAVVAFTAPEAAERRAIWDQHLPPGHTVSDGLLAALAHRCRFTGGQIRNAAVHAALLAVDDGDAIDDRRLSAAVEREYQRAGQTSPLGTARADEPPVRSPFARLTGAGP